LVPDSKSSLASVTVLYLYFGEFSIAIAKSNTPWQFDGDTPIPAAITREFMQSDIGRLSPDSQIFQSPRRVYDRQKCFSPEPNFTGQGFRAIAFPDISRNFTVESDDHAFTYYTIPLSVIHQAEGSLPSIQAYLHDQKAAGIKFVQSTEITIQTTEQRT
jgi:hypothetical protein